MRLAPPQLGVPGPRAWGRRGGACRPGRPPSVASGLSAPGTASTRLAGDPGVPPQGRARGARGAGGMERPGPTGSSFAPSVPCGSRSGGTDPRPPPGASSCQSRSRGLPLRLLLALLLGAAETSQGGFRARARAAPGPFYLQPARSLGRGLPRTRPQSGPPPRSDVIAPAPAQDLRPEARSPHRTPVGHPPLRTQPNPTQVAVARQASGTGWSQELWLQSLHRGAWTSSLSGHGPSPSAVAATRG